MTLYRYEAVASSGALVMGEREAASQDEIVGWLHRLGHIPTRIDTDRPSKLLQLRSLAAINLSLGASRNLAVLTQQLAILFDAGLSLDRVLDVAQTGASRNDRAALKTLAEKVRGGSSLANALADQPDRFPGFYVGMVRAGEASGTLGASFRHLAELMEKSEAVREQVKSALIYPAVVLATGFASLFVLFAVVIPRFRPMFAEVGAALPTSARALMAVADIAQTYWPLIFTAIGGAIVAVISYCRTDHGRRRRDALLLSTPLVGSLVSKVEIARFGRTLGTLLGNGVTPIAALSIARDTISNRVIGEALAPLADDLKEGKGLSRSLTDSGVVPTLALQLIRVGEETARLDTMLLKVADIFDAQTKRAIERLIALLVPAITVVLGILVALVMGSLLKAMMSIYDVAT